MNDTIFIFTEYRKSDGNVIAGAYYTLEGLEAALDQAIGLGPDYGNISFTDLVAAARSPDGFQTDEFIVKIVETVIDDDLGFIGKE